MSVCTAVTTADDTTPTVAIPVRLLPHLRRAAAYLISDHAGRLHGESDLLDTPDDWATFEDARAAVERYLRALDELPEVDAENVWVKVPTSAVALVGDEAATIATYGLDDGVAMQQLAGTLEGLDEIARKAELARELRQLADKVGGED